MNITQIGYRLTVGLALLCGLAHAEPMKQSQFLELIGGTYISVQPSPSLLFRQFEIKPEVRILEKDGAIILENALAVGPKTMAATYRMTRFQCYTHFPESTTCEFSLELMDQGAYVHFLGVHPSVSVNRRASRLTLEISPGYSLAGIRRVPRIILKKAQ